MNSPSLVSPPLGAARTARRLIQTKAWADSTQIAWQVPRDAFATGLTLVARLTDTVSTAGTTPTAKAWSPLQLIKRIDVQHGNGGTKKSITGRDAYLAAAQRRGALPYLDAVSTTELQTTAAAAAQANIPIDFALPDVAELECGVVYPRGQEFLTVTVTTGTETDLYTSGASHVGAVTGYLDLYRNEAGLVTVPSDGLGIFNEFSGGLSAVAAGYNNTIELPVGVWHRGLWVFTEAGSTVALADTVLNQMRVRRNNSEVLFELRREEIQSQMISEQGFNITAAQLVGLHFVDFCRRGKPTPSLTAGLDATQSHSIKVELDCNAVTGATVYYCTQYVEHGVA